MTGRRLRPNAPAVKRLTASSNLAGCSMAYGTAAAAEEVEARRRAEAEEKRIAEGGRRSGKTPSASSGEPDPNDGYIQGWHT